MPKPTDKDLARAEELLARRIFDKYSKLKTAFNARNYNGDGTLSYGDFRQVLRDLGIMFPPNEFRDLCASYDVDGDKEISYPEVMARLATMLDPDGDNIFGFKGASGAVRKGRPTSTGAERLRRLSSLRRRAASSATSRLHCDASRPLARSALPAVSASDEASETHSSCSEAYCCCSSASASASVASGGGGGINSEG